MGTSRRTGSSSKPSAELWLTSRTRSSSVALLDNDGVLTGQGEVDQVQEGGFNGADDGQGVPAIGCSRGAGDVSEVAGEVIRGIGHEVLQQS